MKKLVILALALMLALTAFVIPSMAQETIPAKVGMLTVLNSTQEESVDMLKVCSIAIHRLIENGQIDGILHGSKDSQDLDYGVVYYDTLDAMLMALNAGDITAMTIYRSVAEYLCANNDQLALAVILDEPAESDLGAIEIYRNLLTNDFSFMMMEDREALRDTFSEAIEAIRADGTLDRLVAEQIDAAIAGDDIAPVEMPSIEGAETLKVAVTGALPPMDYIAADGTPAGFNTALLAEISNRIGKNMELVVVDSVGRAAALASGTVDVVFWTRANSWAYGIVNLTEEERAVKISHMKETTPEAEGEVVKLLASLLSPETLSMQDIPKGTIITVPYYSDMILPVTTKAFVESVSAR